MSQGERSDAERRQLAFLADAGAVLDQSLELAETLERLAELPVPDLCDLCIIDVADDDGAIRPAAIAAAEPDAAVSLRAVRERSPLVASSQHPAAAVLRNRVSMLLPEMNADYLDTIASGPEHGALMQRLGYRSAIVTPLTHRGNVLGALSMLRVRDRAAFDSEDLTLATELARRAATAVANARQFELTRHIAVTLQESLLPRTIPAIPGAELVVRYRAAGEAQLVGGDFYDAFVLDERRYGLVIGDVCGKGPEAAALTALARYTIRGAAGVDADPCGVLSALNTAVRQDQGVGGRFLTAIFAIVEPVEHGLRLAIASGGHPAPIVARGDGTAERLETSGPLLGVLPDVTFPLTSLTLEPCDTLVCYTDGITDAGAPRTVLREQDLAALIAGSPCGEPSLIADRLERRALSFGTLRDDMALLLLSSRPDEPNVTDGTDELGAPDERVEPAPVRAGR